MRRSCFASERRTNAEGSTSLFNVGSSEEVTILELAQRILDRTNGSSALHLVPYAEAYAEGFEDMLKPMLDLGHVTLPIDLAGLPTIIYRYGAEG